MSTATASPKPPSTRIASLDQFRGYTVAGMFLVNFLGAYVATPVLLKHHNTFCSYADTIMPQFFFAVGFAFRLTFGRRAQTEGLVSAYGHVVRRMFGLALVALVIYEAPRAADTWQKLVDRGWEAVLAGSVKSWFQTLMHIAVTTIWILPVIRSAPWVRIVFMLFSAALQVVLSHWFYFEWVQTGGIDGGVLGFLSWTIPTLVGTLACDAVTAADGRPRVTGMFVWGGVLMLIGWLLSAPTTLYDVPEEQRGTPREHHWAADPVVPTSERMQSQRLTWAEPPFVPPPGMEAREENYWMMSQRAATLSYHVFAAGLSLALYAAFYVACDVWGWKLGVFRTLGTNALIGYILHGRVDDSVSRFIPRDSPGWYVSAGFILYFAITWLFIRHLEKSNIYLKL